jgi:hypothetical protein
MTLKGLRRNCINLGKCEDEVYRDRMERSGNRTNGLKLAVRLGAEGGVDETTRIVSDEILNLLG